MSRELALLPPRTQMWPELDDSSDVCGFRGIDAVEMAAAMWPSSPSGEPQTELRLPGRGHEAGCDCAGCTHGPAGSNVDRTLTLSGTEKFEGPALRRNTALPLAPDDAGLEREFWVRVRVDGYGSAAKWWRTRYAQLALPLDPPATSEDGIALRLPLRRSSALVIAPGVLTVKWSSAPTGETDEQVLEHVDDCPCDECEAFRALFSPESDEDDVAAEDRVITGFSARSKGRMMRYIASVDWASIREPNERLVGITLTYPGGDWRRWAPTPSSVLSHLTAFCKRFERATG